MPCYEMSEGGLREAEGGVFQRAYLHFKCKDNILPCDGVFSMPGYEVSRGSLREAGEGVLYREYLNV